MAGCSQNPGSMGRVSVHIYIIYLHVLAGLQPLSGAAWKEINLNLRVKNKLGRFVFLSLEARDCKLSTGTMKLSD